MNSPVLEDLRSNTLDVAAAGRRYSQIRSLIPLISLGAEDAADSMAQQVVAHAANLSARIFPIIVLDLPHVQSNGLLNGKGLLKETIESLVLGINPKAIIATIAIDEIEPNATLQVGPATAHPRSVQVDAHGWLIHYSPTGTPAPWRRQPRQAHPASPLAAASIGVAHLMRLAIPEIASLAPPPRPWFLNLLTFTADTTTNPAIGPIDVGELHVFGAGSVGSSALYALAHLKELRGHITIIDKERLKQENLRRYVAMESANCENRKATWAKQILRSAHPSLIVESENVSFDAWAENIGSDQRIDLALISPDTITARREAVDLLPRSCILGGTNGSTAEVIHAHFATTMCGYCPYVDRLESTHQIREDLSRQTGIPAPRLDSLMYLDPREGRVLPLTKVDLGLLAKKMDVQPQSLWHLEGSYLRDFLEKYQSRLYSAVPLNPGRSLHGGTLTLPFVSAFAGALMAAETLKELDPGLHAHSEPYGRYAHDLFEPPSLQRLFLPNRDTTMRCLCHSKYRVREHGKLWPKDIEALQSWSELAP